MEYTKQTSKQKPELIDTENRHAVPKCGMGTWKMDEGGPKVQTSK